MRTRTLVGEILKGAWLLGGIALMLLLNWRLRGEIDWVLILILGATAYLVVRIILQHNAEATDRAPRFKVRSDESGSKEM
jgi:hypothetical protein